MPKGVTQMNFDLGVNYKSTPTAADAGDAERGEATKQQENYKCDVEKAKTSPPKQGPQKNFPN